MCFIGIAKCKFGVLRHLLTRENKWGPVKQFCQELEYSFLRLASDYANKLHHLLLKKKKKKKGSIISSAAMHFV